MTNFFRRIFSPIYRSYLFCFWSIISFPLNLQAWIFNLFNQRRYNRISFPEMISKRKSDTVFVCGTGSSILDLKPDEWSLISQHDVLSFRDFPRQAFVVADFHVTGEIDDVDLYAQQINDNYLYSNTRFLIQEGFNALMGNRFVGFKKLKLNATICRFRRKYRGRMKIFSRSIDSGVVHGYGSIISVVNIAYLMGWKNIVLVGIDLYDHRYFYMPDNETRSVEKRGLTFKSPFTQSSKIVAQLGLWNQHFNVEGVSLYSYNHRSLLVEKLPVFNFSILKD